MALTQKQKLFVKEYLVDLNATRAAIRAGYSEKTAEAIGYENLRKPQIDVAIQAAMTKRSQRVEITQDRVLLEYARLAFFDPRRLFDADGSPKPITELDDDTAAALVGLDMQEVYEGTGDSRVFEGYIKKYKLANKLGALDSLGKHLGLLDGKGGQDGRQENNLLEAIQTSTEEDVDTDDLPEI